MYFTIDGCVNCGAEDRPLFKLPSHIGTIEACGPCIARYGEKVLANEADRILSIYKYRHEPHCLCCKEPMPVNMDGSFNIICTSCMRIGRECVRQAQCHSL